MKTCEKCGNEHNGSYGSGRFCSKKCSYGFSGSKSKGSKKPRKLSGKLVIKNCPTCNAEFEHYETNSRKKKYCSTSCQAKYRMNLEESKIFYSKLAKKTGLGGNRNSYAHGYYDSKFAGKVYLESSYELKVAQELDDNNIKWIRPLPLTYNLNDKDHKYYPDFYLADYDTYLDPKNDFLITQDTIKINKVKKDNNVKIIILDKNNLTWINILRML